MAEKKSKFGDFIKKARQEENQQTGKPDDQISTDFEEQRVAQPVSQTTVKPDDQLTSKPEEKMVNLCVKVPEPLRRHWAAESKRSGITMTDVIIEALNQKFGLPDDQQTR